MLQDMHARGEEASLSSFGFVNSFACCEHGARASGRNRNHGESIASTIVLCSMALAPGFVGAFGWIIALSLPFAAP